MKNLTRLFALVLIFTMLSCTAFAGSEPYTIKFPTFQIGVNTAAEFIAQAVAAFNEQYAGKYIVEVEEVPGDQAYVDKMKVLLAANQLPDVVYAGGYNLLDMALEKDAVLDLTPYLAADPEWASGFSHAALDFNSRDGKVYSIPPQADIIGYFYNKELFAQAQVEPPATWEEFFEVCEMLKAAGVTPLSMDTADSGWVTSLWLMALVGTASEAGEVFANTMFPTDYGIHEFITAAANVQLMFDQYTTPDAVGGAYEHAANNFLAGRTAMIANGAWMITDFSDEAKTDAAFIDKVGVAIYPGGGVVDAANLGYFVAAKDPAAQEAAVEFVKFVTGPEMSYLNMKLTGNLPANLNVVLTDADRADNPLMSELLELSKGAKYRYNYHQSIWYPNTVDEISVLYPALAMGDMTPDVFAQRLSEAAMKN
jgi:raffinose/stachyose/melibiose transport system substrate-binding protein